MSPMMPMAMPIYWGFDCVFIFTTFTSASWFTYFIFAIASAGIAALTVAFPAIRKKILKKEGEPSGQEAKDGRIFFNTCYYLIYSTLHVALMLLVMTYNGGVIIFLIAGLTLGYFFFGYEDKDSDLPINCCANTV